MTITDADLDDYSSVTDAFKHQPAPADCLPVAVKNSLDELADRHDKPQIEHSEKAIKSLCDYDPDFGSSGRLLIPNLSAELQPMGYTVKDQTNSSLEHLNDIIESDQASLPVVTLSPKYFDEIKDWDARSSRRGEHRPHSVVLFKINSSEVLFFDPYGEIQMRSGARTQPKRRLNQRLFLKLWNTERSLPRWVLWVDRLQETTLQHFTEG